MSRLPQKQSLLKERLVHLFPSERYAKLIEVVLGFNILEPTETGIPEFDCHSFRAVDYHRADMGNMNATFSTINWKELHRLCEDDDDGSMFLELLRLTTLQVTLMHSPAKKRPPGAPNSRKVREKYTLKRRRRKLNAQISSLKATNPNSTKIPKLTEQVNLLAYNIQDMIISDLNAKESRAVSTIKTNPKYFYSYAKRFSKSKSTVAPLRDKDGNLTGNAQQKAEILQAQYVEVFSDPLQADVEQCLTHVNPDIDPTTNSLSNISFTEEDIVKAITELDPYSSTPDGDVPARILISCKEQLAIPLKLMWEKSFQDGIIPPSLKMQFITPVYKKGDRTDPANYRPLSITSHLIKTFERVLRNHLVAHLEDNELLNDSQHGFRKKRSCLTQLISHVDSIFECLSSGDEVDVIYLDYAKAFDKVDHNILIAKLERYGINGKMLIWIKEFLSNRMQTVVVEGKKSSFQLVISGVPQGTVLGPVLFILDINDLVEILQYSKGLSFADDTKLSRAIASILCTKLLQEDLYLVIQWSMLNNMQLHEKKFEVLNYTLNKSSLLMQLPFTSEYKEYKTSRGSTLEPTNVVRDLGVYLSNDRSWTPHIEHVAQGGRKIASWVLSVFRDRSPTLMLTLYKTMIRSKLEYCCPVWNPVKISDIQALENIQRNFTRKINGCQGLNYWERLEKLKILSLQRRRERYSIIHIWKMLNNQAPNNINIQSYSTARQGIKIRLPPFNTKAQTSVASDYENSFKINAARLWNLLPKQINTVTSINSFKAELGGFIEKYPDTPPTTGYSAVNRNSLVDWSTERGHTSGGRT